MKIKIDKKHFDRAVNVGVWQAETCILSQAANDAGYKSTEVGTSSGTRLGHANGQARGIQSFFDRHFRMSGDENKPELQALRASLPITIEVEA